MHIDLEFSGGLELLLPKKEKQHRVVLEKIDSIGICELICYIRQTLVCERPELFAEFVKQHEEPLKSEATKSNETQDTLCCRLATVRPGILVLINDCDWEIQGGEDYQVKSGDSISFISTLHGG